MLKDTIPLHSFDYGIVSGIRTDWNVYDELLTCKRPGFSPQSGEVSLYPLQSGSEDQSFVVTDNVTRLWKNFKKYGMIFVSKEIYFRTKKLQLEFFFFHKFHFCLKKYLFVL